MIKILTRHFLPALSVAPLVAFAQGSPEAARGISSPVGVTSILSLVTSLIFVIGAILFVGWLYSRMRGVNLRASKAISILAAQPLGPKEKIVIVGIGDKQIAVGMTPTSLQTLHVFDKPVVLQSESTDATPFADRLRNALGRSSSG
jgi:flagellar protein FliO/FliZ